MGCVAVLTSLGVHSIMFCTTVCKHLQKHQDAFASAFGFFLLGFDVISQYTPPQNIPIRFFSITDPVLWFFKVA